MTKVINFILGLFCLILLQASSCNNEVDQYEREMELKMIDSAEFLLKKTKLHLKVSYPEIQERLPIMEKNLKYIKENYTKEWTEEFRMNIDGYRGVIKVYKKFIEHYEPVVLETEELFTQLKTLKAAVESGKYVGKKEEFKTHYEVEIKDIHNNLWYAERYIKPAKKIERFYQRKQAFVEKVLEQMKK